jgi:hypothetical protein
MSRLLYLAAALLITVSFAFNIPAGLDILAKWQQRDSFQVQTRPLQEQYAVFTERFPETPIPPREMELIVKTHEIISKQSYSPLTTFNLITAALAQSPGLQITNIQWSLQENQSTASTNSPGNLSGNLSSLRGAQDSGFVDAVLQERTELMVRISGQAYSPSSYRAAQDQVQVFMNALQANSGVSVIASRMPTNVRTDIRVSTTVDDGEVRAPFTLDLSLSNTQ